MPSVEKLQQRRVSLAHQHQAHRARVEKLAAQLAQEYNKMITVDTQIALIDRELNLQVDSRIARITDWKPEVLRDED